MCSPRFLLLALLAALLLGGVFPVRAGPGMQSLRFEHLSPDSFGPDRDLQCAVQDDLGQMWLGTSRGLVRYDGRRARVFAADPRTPNSLSHDWVQALHWLPDGQLLVGTAGGLDLLDPVRERVERLSLPGERSVRERAVLSLAPGASGKVWLQTHYQLLWFEPASRRISLVPLPADLHPRKGRTVVLLRGLTSDGKGGVWLAAGDALLHLDAAGQLLQRWGLPDPRSTDGAVVRTMLIDADGRAWLGSGYGLDVVDTHDGRVLDLPERLGLPNGIVHALLQDADGTIWIGMEPQGLWRWAVGAPRAESLPHHPGLDTSSPSDAISALVQDRSGVLWVGSWDRGIALADPYSGGFRQYRRVLGEPDTLGSDLVYALHADDRTHVWVGTNDRGVFRLDLQSGAAEPLDSGDQAVHGVHVLALQSGSGLWVASEDGLYLQPAARGRLQSIDLRPLGMNSRSVLALVPAHDGSLWLGTYGGVYRVRLDEHSRPGQPGLVGRQEAVSKGETIRSLYEDGLGRFWVGSASGLWLYRDGAAVRPLLAETGAIDPERLEVYAVREDRAGRFWLGTQIGLVALEPAGAERWRPQLRQDLSGMPPGPAWNLELDADDALWFSNEQGLSRLAPDRRSLRHFAGRGGRFTAGELPGASAVAADGSLLFGNPGVLRIEPRLLRDNPVAPRVLLSDIRIFNRSLRDAPAPGAGATDVLPTPASLGIDGAIERARRLRLSHRESMVSFDLRAQHFYSPSSIRYAWRLEGFDDHWIQGAPGEGLATYTNLDPGHLRLWAKAANPDGVWGQPQLLAEIDVAPPWWRSVGFRALVAVLLLGGLVAAWQLRMRRMRLTQLRLEAEVARRTAEVQAQRQQIATLSGIGRDLTASLDQEAVKAALVGNLSALMPATAFGLGMVLREEGVIEFQVVMEQGRAYKPYRRSLDAPEQPAARCVNSGEPVWVQRFEHDNRLVDVGQREHASERLELEDGGEPTQAGSGLFVPLKLKGEVRGVLAALSFEPDAFNATHLDVLQTLGAYAAIALDNADAYQQLQAAQSQLVEQRKLAAMSQLVAGVAHELNTPLGNGLLAASTLAEDGRRLRRSAAEGQLRKSDLNNFLQALESGSELLLRSLETASRLVSSFKQLAVNRGSESRARFELAELAADLSAARSRQLAAAGCRLVLDVPAGLMLDSYPGPLRQVLDQLVDNALEHGLAGRPGGVLTLSAAALGTSQVRLRFSDDGHGIAPEHLGRIFDPFYTTRFGRGSNGLGLHLCYILITSLLGGQVSVSSEPGQGAEFEIVLPREAPES